MSMTDNRPTFRTVIRGYDPAAVDGRIAELTAALRRARSQLARPIAAAEATREEPHPPSTATAAESFQGLGQLADRMLALVRAETARMRAEAVAEIQARLEAADAAASQLKVDADSYAEGRRAEAATDAAQGAAEATKAAGEVRDDAARRARQIIDEAVARADRIRSETDQQSAVAAQRRDSINAQLAAVRQMLSMLTPEDADAPPPNGDVTPTDAVAPNGDVTPTDAVAPNGDVTPTDAVAPNGDETPTDGAVRVAAGPPQRLIAMAPNGRH
ncbi:MAG: hypothetical protein ABI429_05290 [Jatrophihabitantaceae bacterium]